MQELVRDPMLPCTTSLLDNLRKVKLRMIKFDMGETAVIGKLLESASALEKMKVQMPYLSSKTKIKADAFLEKLIYLKRASTKARICVEYCWKKLSYRGGATPFNHLVEQALQQKIVPCKRAFLFFFLFRTRDFLLSLSSNIQCCSICS